MRPIRMYFEPYLVVMVMVMTVLGGSLAEGDEGIVAAMGQGNLPAMDNWIDRLYRDKMTGYNKNARPVNNHNHNTTVTLGLSLKNIDLDDQKQEFSVNAWTIMTWKDEFLHWVPEDYMKIDRIHFDDGDIWLPDITVYNSAEGSVAHPFGEVPVLADYKGQAYWFPPTHITIKCDLDLTDWPRDEHVCLVRMGSWSHHGEQIDIQILKHNTSFGVMTDTLEENNRWKLVNVTSKRTLTSLEGHDPYVEVNFSFKVKREGRTHAAYINQSTLAMVVVVLASYILPLRRQLSRLIMHLFSLGGLITCFVTLFALLPANGGPVPIVVRYYAGSIVLTTLSLLATICLTTRVCCCCCCDSSSSSSSQSSSLGKTLVSMVSSPSRFRSAVVPQAGSSSGSPYNNLENEVSLEEEEQEEQRRPRATQLNQEDGSVNYARLQEEGGGQADRVTSNQFLKVLNFLVATLFIIAFAVDYVVLRNVMR